MSESMAELVWSKYQNALIKIELQKDQIWQQDRAIEGLKAQAKDWKARTRILAKRCKEYEAALKA